MASNFHHVWGLVARLLAEPGTWQSWAVMEPAQADQTLSSTAACEDGAGSCRMGQFAVALESGASAQYGPISTGSSGADHNLPHPSRPWAKARPAPKPGEHQKSGVECRVPWRLAAWRQLSDDPRLEPLMQRLAAFAASQDCIAAGYTLDGQPLVNYTDLAFLAPFWALLQVLLQGLTISIHYMGQALGFEQGLLMASPLGVFRPCIFVARHSPWSTARTWHPSGHFCR